MRSCSCCHGFWGWQEKVSVKSLICLTFHCKNTNIFLQYGIYSFFQLTFSKTITIRFDWYEIWLDFLFFYFIFFYFLRATMAFAGILLAIYTQLHLCNHHPNKIHLSNSQIKTFLQNGTQQEKFSSPSSRPRYVLVQFLLLPHEQ